QLVSQYNLTYYTQTLSLTSDASIYSSPNWVPEGTRKLTLKQIQRVGSDGTTALPPTTFSYGTTRGTNIVPNGDWNRLNSVNNGQGGGIAFTYENIANASDVGS